MSFINYFIFLPFFVWIDLVKFETCLVVNNCLNESIDWFKLRCYCNWQLPDFFIFSHVDQFYTQTMKKVLQFQVINVDQLIVTAKSIYHHKIEGLLLWFLGIVGLTIQFCFFFRIKWINTESGHGPNASLPVDTR